MCGGNIGRAAARIRTITQRDPPIIKYVLNTPWARQTRGGQDTRHDTTLFRQDIVMQNTLCVATTPSGLVRFRVHLQPVGVDRCRTNKSKQVHKRGASPFRLAPPPRAAQSAACSFAPRTCHVRSDVCADLASPSFPLASPHPCGTDLAGR